MKYAIIESGGKQYKAVEGETIEVDRLDIEKGKKLDLSEVLLIADGDTVEVGTPTISGANVKTTVVDEIKAPKVIIFKYHPRKRYRLKRGHRQKYTLLMIDSINSKAEPKAKTAAKTVAEKAEVKEAPAAKPAAKTVAKTAAKTATKTAAKTAKPKTATKKTATKKTATKKTATKKTTTKKTSTDKK